MASKIPNVTHGKPRKQPKPHRTPTSRVKEHRTLRSVQSFDANKKSMSSNAIALATCKSLIALMPQVEHKWPVPSYRGSGAPVSLFNTPPEYKTEETKESKAMKFTLRGLFGTRHYRFRISTALNMSSSGAGAVNSTIAVSAIQFTSDFIALTSVFDEFFVVGMRNTWVPVSRYQYPLGGTSILSVANLPIGLADLQHNATAYTSLATMTENHRFSPHSTGDPFTYDWINTEKQNETVLATTSGATQSWCTVGNAANYAGMVQAISQSTPPALPFSQVLGTFLTYWEVIFRIRE